MDNLQITDNTAVLNVNPKIYPLEIIYSAAYVFLDKAYVLLDGNPESEIKITLTPKSETDLKQLGGEFLNELINYADYNKRAEKTKIIREMLLQRALVTNDSNVLDNYTDDADLLEEIENLEEDDDYLDDPEGIAVPWDEKHSSGAEIEDPEGIAKPWSDNNEKSKE